jgi:hypothetical protein
MARFLLSDEWVKKLCEAIGEDPRMCRRIIVDCKVGNAVQVYVEKFGTDKLLMLGIPDVSEAEIKII